MRPSAGHTRFGRPLAALLLFTACTDDSAPSTDAACEDSPAIDAEEALDLYLAAWGQEDPQERACMLQRSVAADAVLLTADAPSEGRAAIVQDLDGRIADLHEDQEHRDTAGPIATRHEEARLSWQTTAASGEVTTRGEDWLEFSSDGLLTRIHILAGAGMPAPVNDQLLAWERAWNASDVASRAAALRQATTQDVRFTDLLSDIRGRDALQDEIGRQRDAVNAQLDLDDNLEVFFADDEAALLRITAQLVLPNGEPIDVVDYVRLRGGVIERLSGFPNPAP